MMDNEYRERGYLNDPYRIFYLNGAPETVVPFHYHEFLKILVLLDGKIGYEIEGRHYELQPGDLVLVRPGEIHRPVVHAHETYGRIILYLSDAFLRPFPQIADSGERQVLRSAAPDVVLPDAGMRPGKEYGGALRTGAGRMPGYPAETGDHPLRAELWSAVSRLPLASDAVCKAYENGKILQDCRLTEFLFLLNECLKEQAQDLRPVSQNENVRRAIDYIGAHIVEELSVDTVAEAVHLNRSYLMHMFRAETGYTVKGFITEKRLFIAGSLIRRGVSLTDACYQSGFSNYSGFYRAWQRRFGVSPREGHRGGNGLRETEISTE